MASVVSLSKLFATGRLGFLHLGFLHPELSLADAALALGPPTSWSRRTDPLHGEVWAWHYGELELVFGAESPWPFYFLAVQGLPDVVDAAGCLIVRNALGPAMVIELDGIDGRLRPSDALSLVLRRGDPARIFYWPLGRDDTLDASLLTVAAGDVAVCFEVWDDEIGGNASLAALNDAELWRRLGKAASVQRLLFGARAADPVAAGVAPSHLNPSHLNPRRLDPSLLDPSLLDPSLLDPSPRDDAATSAPASARVRPAVARVPVAEFLATGRLGPVHAGLDRSRIASLLGAPDGWIGKPAGDAALPLYWAYGKLEFSFDVRPPHAIDFFQIEFAHLLSGDCEILAGGRIVLELHGLDGRSRPSDVLRVMRDRVMQDGAGAFSVFYSRPTTTGSFVLNLSSGTVTLVFDSEFPEGTLPELTTLADPAYLRRCDAFAQLDSIYVHAARPTQVPSGETRKVAAVEYLAAMFGEP